VAKHGYVVGQAGWFSCRSACYLAAGRPVVVQDTGFSDVLPVGEGIVAFRTVDEAVAGIADVESKYERHSRAAREIAEEFFDSSRVLEELIDRAMKEA
jgi:glycosyltransferase involved in cell wall biosynthesis